MSHLQVTLDAPEEVVAGERVAFAVEGQTVQAILRLDTLDPGASMTLGDVWDQHDDGGRDVPPGFYFLQAEVLTDGKPLVSQAKKLRVTKG